MSPWISDLYLRSQTDARLLSLTRDGHGRAFAVLAERYRAELLGQARRLSGSANAEDLLQQTLLSAFAALNRGTEVGHVRGWLHAILRNSATRARGPVEAPLELAVQAGEAPDALLEARADARLVLSALDELPTRQREALVGSTFKGMSRAELATTLGVSEGAVRQLVHRARSTVRAAITSVTPYPVVRWLAGAGGSASSAPPELALATGAAGAGGVVAKLGMLAAAGAIAASGLVAAGHHEAREGAGAGHRIQATRARNDTVAAVTAFRSASAGSGAGEFVTGSARAMGRARVSASPGDGFSGHAKGTDRGGQPGSTRPGGGERSRGQLPTRGGSVSGRDGGSGGGSDGGSRGGSDGAVSRPPSGSDGSGGSDAPGPRGQSGAGSGSGSGSGSGGDGSSAGSGDTSRAAAPSAPMPTATTASDGGGVSGGGGSNSGRGPSPTTQGSGGSADGTQTTETSTTSTGSRDLLPPAGSSLSTDH